MILDENCKPWLLEVNHAPSFKTESLLDEVIKGNLLLDALKLVFLADPIPEVLGGFFRIFPSHCPGYTEYIEALLKKAKEVENDILFKGIKKAFERTPKKVKEPMNESPLSSGKGNQAMNLSFNAGFQMLLNGPSKSMRSSHLEAFKLAAGISKQKPIRPTSTQRRITRTSSPISKRANIEIVSFCRMDSDSTQMPSQAPLAALNERESDLNAFDADFGPPIQREVKVASRSKTKDAIIKKGRLPRKAVENTVSEVSWPHETSLVLRQDNKVAGMRSNDSFLSQQTSKRAKTKENKSKEAQKTTQKLGTPRKCFKSFETLKKIGASPFLCQIPTSLPKHIIVFPERTGSPSSNLRKKELKRPPQKQFEPPRLNSSNNFLKKFSKLQAASNQFSDSPGNKKLYFQDYLETAIRSRNGVIYEHLKRKFQENIEKSQQSFKDKAASVSLEFSDKQFVESSPIQG